jgi:hypothetical protein
MHGIGILLHLDDPGAEDGAFQRHGRRYYRRRISDSLAATSFLTSVFGSGRSTGKCNALFVIV